MLSDSTSEYPQFVHAEADLGTSIFGIQTYYPFDVVISSNATFPNAIWVQVGTELKNFTLQNQLFFVPSLSSIHSAYGYGEVELNITAVAPISDIPQLVEAEVAIPSPQHGTLSPKIVIQKVPLEKCGIIDLYTVFSGVVRVREELLGFTKIDIKGLINQAWVTDEYNSLDNVPRN